MTENNKFGLSRNRLFESSRVAFYGEYEPFDKKEVLKAFKMLCEKEPLITSNVSLDENGDAFVNTGAVEQNLFFEEKTDAYEYYKEKRGEMLFPFSSLFEFYIVNEKSLLIFANPAAADVKSLYILAGEFISFYNKSLLDVAQKNIFLYSQKKDIPLNVNSIIIDKVSSDLEMNWQKRPKSFNADDYRNLYESIKKRRTSDFSFELNEDETNGIREKCLQKKIDFCSLCCYAFKKTLLEYFKGNNKYKNVGVLADLRLYEDEPSEYGVGPFDARVNVMKFHGRKNAGKDEIQLFHEEYLKKVANPFHAYYDNLILMNLSPFYCDAAHFYENGIYKRKSAKKLVNGYGCRDKRVMSFDFYNLDSEVWQKLGCFSFVDASEANSGKYDFEVRVFVNKGSAVFRITCNKEKCDEEKLKLICEKSVDIIKTVQ